MTNLKNNVLLLFLIMIVVNACHKGSWEMLYDKIFDSWTPDIRVEKGRKQMYWPLLKLFDSTEKMWYPLQVILRNPPKAI